MTMARLGKGSSRISISKSPQGSSADSVRRSSSKAILGDALSPAPQVVRSGFVCPPCGRFIVTEIDGVLYRTRTGSKPRFCSPGCRQAAYRRRRAGAQENTPLQYKGGRGRRLGVPRVPIPDPSREKPTSNKTKEPR